MNLDSYAKAAFAAGGGHVAGKYRFGRVRR